MALAVALTVLTVWCAFKTAVPTHVTTVSLGNTPETIDAVLKPIVTAPVERDTVHPNGPPPLFWSEVGHSYRAIHSISVWDVKTHTWRAISPNLTEDSTQGAEGYGVDGITALAHANDTWYVGTLVGGIKVKLPHQGWKNVVGNFPSRTVTAVAICPSVPDGRYAVIGFGGYGTATPSQPGHVYATSDGGATWTDITGNLPDKPIESIQFRSDAGRWVLSVKINDQWFDSSGSDGQWVSTP
jgi:hypothetical protein